jgi:hypothetical protein
MDQRQPKNIFEQIVLSQEIVNDNIVALADNLNVMNTKLEKLMEILDSPPMITSSEPYASGAETQEQ